MAHRPHPELNFSRGRGMRFDARAFVKACRLLGMTDEEIIEAVKRVVNAKDEAELTEQQRAAIAKATNGKD